ncbi:MAG: hypothetical protein NTZ78_02685 [Candidatus Aureabacteria bacterium]|nr:hypothetical protein [Candidatus Auribacterota bacterium]
MEKYSGFPRREINIDVWLLRYGKTFFSPLTIALESPLFSSIHGKDAKMDFMIFTFCHEFVHVNFVQDILLNAKSPGEKSTRWVVPCL